MPMPAGTIPLLLSQLDRIPQIVDAFTAVSGGLTIPEPLPPSNQPDAIEGELKRILLGLDGIATRFLQPWQHGLTLEELLQLPYPLLEALTFAVDVLKIPDHPDMLPPDQRGRVVTKWDLVLRAYLRLIQNFDTTVEFDIPGVPELLEDPIEAAAGGVLRFALRVGAPTALEIGWRYATARLGKPVEAIQPMLVQLERLDEILAPWMSARRGAAFTSLLPAGGATPAELNELLVDFDRAVASFLQPFSGGLTTSEILLLPQPAMELVTVGAAVLDIPNHPMDLDPSDRGLMLTKYDLALRLYRRITDSINPAIEFDLRGVPEWVENPLERVASRAVHAAIRHGGEAALEIAWRYGKNRWSDTIAG